MQFPAEVLEGLKLGEPITAESLVVYPVLRRPEPNGHAELVDLDEAIAGGRVEITEVSEAGSVPNLKVSNESPRPLVIFDGEELIGAKQDRIVNVTIIVAALGKLVIPVSCVERGRWRWTSRRFAAGEFVYPSLRREKFVHVSENLRAGLGFHSDQSEIWSGLSAKSARMGLHSETGAMSEMSGRALSDPGELEARFPHRPGQIGYLAFIRGGFAGGDVFPSEEISRRKYRKLVRAYWLDSIDPGAEFPAIEPYRILAEVASAEATAVDSVGEGREVRFESPRLQGALTRFEGRLVHLEIFPRVDRPARAGRGAGPVVY
jgi:hypothetical protein